MKFKEPGYEMQQRVYLGMVNKIKMPAV